VPAPASSRSLLLPPPLMLMLMLHHTRLETLTRMAESLYRPLRPVDTGTAGASSNGHTTNKAPTSSLSAAAGVQGVDDRIGRSALRALRQQHDDVSRQVNAVNAIAFAGRRGMAA
jgi:hypothetical protein